MSFNSEPGRTGGTAGGELGRIDSDLYLMVVQCPAIESIAVSGRLSGWGRTTSGPAGRGWTWDWTTPAPIAHHRLLSYSFPSCVYCTVYPTRLLLQWISCQTVAIQLTRLLLCTTAANESEILQLIAKICLKLFMDTSGRLVSSEIIASDCLICGGD